VEQSVISFLRKLRSGKDVIAAIFNFTPVPRYNYRVGVPRGGVWRELLNSDNWEYGGAGHNNQSGVKASPIRWHARNYSLNLTLPPLGMMFLKSEGNNR